MKKIIFDLIRNNIGLLCIGSRYVELLDLVTDGKGTFKISSMFLRRLRFDSSSFDSWRKLYDWCSAGSLLHHLRSSTFGEYTKLAVPSVSSCLWMLKIPVFFQNIKCRPLCADRLAELSIPVPDAPGTSNLSSVRFSAMETFKTEVVCILMPRLPPSSKWKWE